MHAKNERYYHSLILSWLLAYGFDIKSEDLTSDGRIDAIYERKDSIVIIEFKYSHDKKDDEEKVVLAKAIATLLDDAFTQIHDKQYYKKYYNKDKIILLGVAISNKEISVKFVLFK